MDCRQIRRVAALGALVAAAALGWTLPSGATRAAGLRSYAARSSR